jgi:hypothetical protein
LEVYKLSSDWISVIITIVLVIVTGYYAIITHRIMKYQRDITILEYRPFLKLDEIQVTKLVDENSKMKGIRIGIELNNVGRILLKYEVKNMFASIEDKISNKVVFLNNGGYVYPGQTVSFTYGVIEIDEEEAPEVLEGILEYELTYFSTEKKKYKSYRKYLLTYFSKSNRIEWKSLEENEIEE